MSDYNEPPRHHAMTTQEKQERRRRQKRISEAKRRAKKKAEEAKKARRREYMRRYRQRKREMSSVGGGDRPQPVQTPPTIAPRVGGHLEHWQLQGQERAARSGFMPTVMPAIYRKRRQEMFNFIQKVTRNARINERRGLALQPREQQGTKSPREQFYAVAEFLEKSAICGNTLDAIDDLTIAFSDLNPHLKEIVVETGIVEKFLVKNLAPNFMAPKIVEALARLSETQQYLAIVASPGAMEKLVGFIGDEKEGLRRDSMTCLANILEHDDQEDLWGWLLMDNEVVGGIVQNLKQRSDAGVLQSAVFLASWLCKYVTPDRLLFARVLAQPLCNVLLQPDCRSLVNDSVRGNVFFALYFLFGGKENSTIDELLATGILPILVESLEGNFHPCVYAGALDRLAYIAAGDTTHTQAVVESGVLKHLMKMVRSENHLVQGKAIFLMSNIAGGTHEQISRMLRVHKLLEEAISAGVQGPLPILYEASITVVGICLRGTPEHIGKVVESDGIKIVAEVLRQQIPPLAPHLHALDKLFEVGKTHQLPYPQSFEEYSVKAILVDLKLHSSPDVSNRVCYLLEKHFGYVDDEIDENLVPAKAANDTYIFGTVAPKKP